MSALALVPFIGAQGAGVVVVPFPPFFNASPPPPRAAPSTEPAYVPQATPLAPQRPLPPAVCYTPTTICPLSDQQLVGHACSCNTKTSRVAGRALIPPSVSGKIPPSVSGSAQGGGRPTPPG
jgi:hypothetical protein